MARIKVAHDQRVHTPTFWFGNPVDEFIAEETGEEVILMKNKPGNVLGFEKLNYSLPKSARLSVAFETVAA